MTYNIKDFDAKEETLSTRAIQSAIDRCAENGGGTVLIPDGTFLTGTLFLRSKVTLFLAAGARLLMSPNAEDFPAFACEWDTKEAPRFSARCLLYIGNCENVSIEGLGKIDCNAAAYCEENPKPCFSDTDPFLCKRMKRKLDIPDSIGRMIFVMKSQNVTLKDFTLTELAGGWGIWINGSSYINVRALKIYCCPDYPNSDGIHINCSHDVFVTDCAVHTGDDALIVRANTNTLAEDIPCENVIIKGCTLSSHCQAIRVGWIGDGAIRNCIFSDLVITDSRDGITIELPENSARGDLGKNITRIERLSFQNLLIDRTCRHPIRITIAESELTRCSYVRDISFANVNSRSEFFPKLQGRPDVYLEDISFINCRFTVGERAGDGFHPRYVKNLRTDCTTNAD